MWNTLSGVHEILIYIYVSGGNVSSSRGRQRRIGRSGPPTGNFRLDDDSSSSSSDDDDDMVRPATARTRLDFINFIDLGAVTSLTFESMAIPYCI